MTYIDVHCHLDFCKDIHGIINRAKNNDVSIIVTHGVNPKSNKKALELAEKYREVKAALGIYPIDALKLSWRKIDKEIEFIKKNKNKVSAIGEVGLDYKEDGKEHDKQKKVFEKFVKLSIEIKKPIVVHSRKAEQECIEILEKMKVKKAVMHCFCGKWKLVERIVKNSWFLSIPTNITFSQQFQNIAKNISLGNLLCETDSPYLHPEKKSDNEPSLVIESYRKIAEIKKIKIVEVRDKIKKNFERLCCI